MAVASSSSSSLPADVFLNFRGEDTRKSFICHLHAALERQAVKAYFDSEDLRKGDDLSVLLKAITNSKLSIVVFSQNYATSTWCLKELVQILKCKAEQKQIVMPVFYQVDPSHVRKQEGSFAQAFAKHERNDDLLQEVNTWRSALTEAANSSGWDSRQYKDDAQLITHIVEDVSEKLIRIWPSKGSDNLVGMDSHLREMRLRLCLAIDDVRVVGIWGMGGIGKTTIARAVYGEIGHQFHHSCFLDNVREGFMKSGEEHMKRQFRESIFKEKTSRLGTLERLGNRKVLLVLDDVDRFNQIETLIGKKPSFGGGSRIIVTTRDSHVLNGFELEIFTYKPELLSNDEALGLFMRHAFGPNEPSREYDDLSSRAIQYAHGLPLALKVLGGFLKNKSVLVWEDELDKLKENPNSGMHSEIQNVLRTNVDALDPFQKNLFLDIACFFKGMHKKYAEICGFHARSGLRVLADRALVTISEFGGLEMHDLLQEIGREIVYGESPKKPWKRTRLWSYEDVRDVLRQNKATNVESIMVELSNSKDIYLNVEAFVSMINLRLLRITYPKRFKDSYNPFEECIEGESWPEKIYQAMDCKLHLNGDPEFLSHKLRVLVWHGCPLKSLPFNFDPKNLVDLDMRCSHIEQLWEGTKQAKHLISINLSCCEYLTKIPLCTEATKLEKLILQGCISLLEVHPSISALTGLVFLNLQGCTKLKSLPSSIHMKSLKTLVLSNCSNLEMFPEISEDMEALSKLYLHGTAIKELPSSIDRLRRLESLSMQNCKNLVCLPNSISHLAELRFLDLSGCSNLDKFPEIYETMEALSELTLDGTAIKELPSSIERLQTLESLSMENCTSLVCLPDSICNLAELRYLDLRGCSKLYNLPENFGSLESLLELQVGESGLEQLPVSILDLKLGRLFFNDCKQMVAPLSSWPSSIEDCCTVVVYLDFSDCCLLELSDAIAHFCSLKVLKLSRTNLESLPAIMNRLVCLEQLELEGCKRLKSIPELSSSISYINADDCTALETVSTPKHPYDMGRCFTFVNCNQLVQNDLFRDIVETHYPTEGNYSRSFYMCFPGSEIPERFIHQCRGSLVTAQLPPNWFGNKFLGFAICAVINKPQDVNFNYGLSALCVCSFKGKHCEYRFSFYLFPRVVDINFQFFDFFSCLESNHIFLGYVPWSEFGINAEEVNQRCYTEAKFHIQLLDQEQTHMPPRFDRNIKNCGVQFFFANNEEVAHQPMVHSERSLERCSAETSGSDITSGISDEEQYLELSELFGGAKRNSSEYDYMSDESDCEIEDTDSSGKRKILSRWTQKVRVTSGLMQGPLDDGFSWYCNGQNCICDQVTGELTHLRYSDYTCAHHPSCWAKSSVLQNFIDDDPTILEITYIGRHTCWKTLPMLTHQVRVTPGMGLEGPFDGFSWGKYGQMDLPRAKYPRVYYVCTPQNVQGCMAIKEVQRSNDDPTILKITYRGRHTCIQAYTISIGGRGDGRISEGGGALRIGGQVVQSPSSLGDNGSGGNAIRLADRAMDDNNVNMLPDANSRDMEHSQDVNHMANKDVAGYPNHGGCVSEGASDAVVHQKRVSLRKRTLRTLWSLCTAASRKKK